MDSLEFTTKIERGVIRLPKEFEGYENAIAHVSITLENSEDLKTKKVNLRKAFKKRRKPDFLRRSKIRSNGSEN